MPFTQSKRSVLLLFVVPACKHAAALMLLACCMFANATQSASNTSPPAKPAPNNSHTNEDDDYCKFALWYDDWYCHLNDGIDTTVNEVNDWFELAPSPTKPLARASGRIRMGWEPRSGSWGDFDSRFKIRVKLPALKDRVELFFTDEEDDINELPVKAARNAQLGNQEEPTIAIQFREPSSHLAYRIGFGRGGQMYARSRYADQWRLSPEVKINYFTELNYYSRDRFGTEFNAQYSQQISTDQAFEFNNSIRYRQRSDDWLWHHEINYLYLHDSKQSFLFTAFIDGVSEPSYRQDQGLVSLRYKRNLLRPWFFVEIEPFVVWLRKEDFRTSVGIALRAEVHFGVYD